MSQPLAVGGGWGTLHHAFRRTSRRPRDPRSAGFFHNVSGTSPGARANARPNPFRRHPRHRRLFRGRRGGHQQRPAVLLHRRPASRCRPRGAGADRRRPGQRRLPASAPPHHRQPGAGGHSENRLGTRPAHRAGGPRGQRPAPGRGAARPHGRRRDRPGGRPPPRSWRACRWRSRRGMPGAAA